MIYELQKAILDRYNSAAGASLRSLTQGIFEDEAPASIALATQDGQELERSTLPFIVFSLIFTGLEQDFCSNMYEPFVQFTIFDDGNNKTSRDALLAGNAFLALYDNVHLPMDNGYTMIRSDTVGQRKFKDPDKMWNIVYELLMIVEVNAPNR